MSDYRRWRVAGGDLFLTLVTYGRRPLLNSDRGRRYLRSAIDAVRAERPFQLFASVLLPDHLHLVMRLPADDADYSTRIKLIKRRFSQAWVEAGQLEAKVTSAQEEKGERGVWQPRFWEHTIRGEDDLERCVNYIHWNPRKHGLVKRVRDWRWSSFHRFVEAGDYPIEWGGTEPACLSVQRSWGEP